MVCPFQKDKARKERPWSPTQYLEAGKRAEFWERRNREVAAEDERDNLPHFISELYTQLPLSTRTHTHNPMASCNPVVTGLV